MVLSPINTKILGKYGVNGFHTNIGDILFQVLVCKKTYIFENLINSKNYTILEKLITEEVIEVIPSSYIKSAKSKLDKVLENKYNLSSRFDYYNGRELINIRETSRIDEYYYLLESFYPSLVSGNGFLDDQNTISSEDEYNIDSLILNARRYLENQSNTLNFSLGFSEQILSPSKKVLNDFLYYPEERPLSYYLHEKFGNGTSFNHLNLDNETWKYYEYYLREQNKIGHQKTLRERAKEYAKINKQRDIPLSKKYINDYLNLLKGYTYFIASTLFCEEKNTLMSFTANNSFSQLSNSATLDEIISNKDSSIHSLIYRILLNKVNFVEIRNIDVLLKLRDKKSIDRFRKAIFDWITIFHSNDIKEISNIYKNIEQSNKELKALEIRKQKDWVFYIALPLSIIGLISGLPLSIIPLTLSGYLKIDNFYKSRKNNWIILKN